MTDATPRPSARDIDVRHISSEDAKAIVLPNHYSGTWNGKFGQINFGIFDGDELCGAAVFGHLQNPSSSSSLADLPSGSIIELNRLWIDDRFGRNTETAMLAKCWSYMRQHTRIELVQSFADGRLGVGTIYKAANFGYYGAERTRFYRRRSTGEVFHSVLTNNTAKLPAMVRTNEWWVDGDLETFLVNSYRYLYPLTRRARRAIKLWPEPYPPYSKGEIPTPDYRVPLAQVARCYAYCEARGDNARAQKFLDYLASEAAPEELERLIEQAEDNAWVAQVRAEATAQPSLFETEGVA